MLQFERADKNKLSDVHGAGVPVDDVQYEIRRVRLLWGMADDRTHLRCFLAARDARRSY